MGWYVTQLWMQLIIAMLIGLFAGWLLWRWGWKKHVLTQEHEVTRLRLAVAEKDRLAADHQHARAQFADASARADAASGALAAANARSAELEAELAAMRAELDAAHAARVQAESLVIDLRDEDPDDLKVIEGIGPKMEQALFAAGIRTWKRLARTDEATLRTAVEQAGMNFAPSLVTWAEQAGHLARGDFEGFKALTDRLVAGRAPEQG